MTDITNVLPTGQDAVFQSRLDRKQFVSLVEFVAERAKAADDAITTEMRNALVLVGQRLDLIDRKAEVFDKPETEALEAAFNQFLGTSGVTSLLGAMSISINGSDYSVASVINVLVNADKIVAKEVLASDADDLPTTVKYTLHDGYEVMMDYSRSDDPATGVTTISGYANDWRGLEATETLEFSAMNTDRTLLGATFTDTRYNLLRSTHILFDLTGALEAASVIASSAPDLDGDGIVGTPTGG